MHALVRVLARRQAHMSNGQLRFSWCVAHWRQLLSVALQRGVSRAVDFACARTERAAGGPVPDLGAYRASRLLGGVGGAGTGDGGAPGGAAGSGAGGASGAAGVRDNNVEARHALPALRPRVVAAGLLVARRALGQCPIRATHTRLHTDVQRRPE